MEISLGFHFCLHWVDLCSFLGPRPRGAGELDEHRLSSLCAIMASQGVLSAFSQRIQVAAASMAVRMVARFMPNDPILRRKASMRAVAVASTAVRVCAWTMVPAVILGAQCLFVSATSMGMTVWARVLYDGGVDTLESLEKLKTKSTAVLSNIYLSTVQKQTPEGNAQTGRRKINSQPSLTEANLIIAMSEMRRIADLEAERVKAAPQQQEDAVSMCDA